MSGGLDLRKRGARSAKPRSAPGGPLSALENAGHGETRVSVEQMTAISQLYWSSTSFQAARQILLGQLLSSGIAVRRQGKDVELTEDFAHFIEATWLPFARDVVDSFLQFGFVAVSIEEELPEPFAPASKRARRSLPSQTGAKVTAKLGENDKRANLVPIVAEIGTYEVSFIHGGRGGYRREYRVSCLSANQSYTIDDQMGLFWKTPCDTNGNLCSPVATGFESASFISSLTELALNAEVIRSRTQLITQSQPKPPGSGALDAANLFFDSESRAIQTGDAAEADRAQAQSLSLVTKLCDVIARVRVLNQAQPNGVGNRGWLMCAVLLLLQNKYQTTNSSGGSSTAPTSHLPPEIPPRLFTVPKEQSVVTGHRPPESRNDLEGLMRWSNDAVCAAMGVPASIIFEGKFSSNSMSQLQARAPHPPRPIGLLNTTVASLGISVSSVLTSCYHACYGDLSASTDNDTLVLVTSPLSSISEVEALYTAGVIDWLSAVPTALHSLGASASEIEQALVRRKKAEKETEAAAKRSEETEQTANENAKEGVNTQKAQTELVEAQTEKTKAEAKATLKPPARPETASSGSSGGSSSKSK